MDNIETTCEACHGLRYSPEALEYKLDGMNIAQVMDLSVRRASEFFKETSIEEKLKPMMDVGLHYLHLNQALSTLSGGELQRLKIASYLQQYTMPLEQGGQRGVFVIDEPTDGLHLKDVRHLIDLFEQMVDMGNTVYVIEHNTDVIKAADHVIELGPGAGDLGGTVIYQGNPRGMLACPTSITAPYLKLNN
jgi:excinuclease UvrABC ATPase subunit